MEKQNETKVNAKIIKTKKALLEAYYRLADTCRLEEITVSSLCREAGINRTTFYKYYAVPSDVLEEAIQKMVAETRYFSPDASVYENMLKFCRSIYENRRFIHLYFSAGGDLMPIIYRSISAAIGNDDFMKKPVNNFLAGGVGGIAMYWLNRGFSDSPEAMAELLAGYVGKLL